MEKKTDLNKIEDLAKQIEKEQDFEKVIELFSTAAGLVKQTVTGVSKGRGKLLEIIRDIDSFIEKELKDEGDGQC